MLPALAEATGGGLPLILDSGVRTGADVFKALALGATAIAVGRPYVYGLAIDGQAGVAEVLANLWADFELTMRLSGCTTVREITAQQLHPLGQWQ
jgi:lactate 2-monooxygenase